MKAVAVSIALLLFIGGTYPSAGQSPKANLDPALQAAERTWLDALQRADMAVLDAGASKQFTLLTPIGIATRDDLFGKMRERFPGGRPLDSPNTYTLADQTVQAYEDVAVLSELCTVSGSSTAPVISPGRFWLTEVWHKETGVWKIVHLHITPFEHGM